MREVFFDEWIGAPENPTFLELLEESGSVGDDSYRYLLWRNWNPSLSTCAWVMCNPSTADEYTDDPTITACIRFSKAWGFGSIRVVNLFAWRATDPRDLLIPEDPVGPRNRHYQRMVSINCEQLVVAWGASVEHAGRLKFEAISDFSKIYRAAQAEKRWKWPLMRAQCLGHTKRGYPRHPLYAGRSRELERFRGFESWR